MEKRKFEVNINKAIYRYYTYEIEAATKEAAIEKVNHLLSNGNIKDKDLFFSQEEADYSVEDNPDAYTVVDAIEIRE